MKAVTATEARKGWFRLLDEVVEGEVVVVDRHGVLVELRRLDRNGDAGWQPPEYDRVLRVAEADTADRWGWDWDADTGQLCPVPRDEP